MYIVSALNLILTEMMMLCNYAKCVVFLGIYLSIPRKYYIMFAWMQWTLVIYVDVRCW